MTLRAPQILAVEAVETAATHGAGRGLVVLPTGVGKTVVAATVAKKLGMKTIFLCHRDQLISQATRTFSSAWIDAKVGVIHGPTNDWIGKDVVVASIHSLSASRIACLPRDEWGLVVCDEAHHAASKLWSRVLDYFVCRFRLGLSATPFRLDRAKIDRWFGGPLFHYSIRDAVRDGFLCAPVSKEVRTKIRIVGELRCKKKLSGIINDPERNRQVVQAWQDHAFGRKTIAFCVDVSHCDSMAQEFRERGVRCEAVHSRNPLRNRDILDRFSSGETEVLTNCEVLTEGFDAPEIACVLMARPTMSRGLYIQMVGRGLRISPGKKDCLIIDFTDNCNRHKLASMSEAMDEPGPRRGVAGSSSIARDPRDPQDIEVVGWRVLENFPWPSYPTLHGYAPLFPFDLEKATDAQRRSLRKFGCVDMPDTFGEASWILDQCAFNEISSSATRKQEWFLRSIGKWEDGMTKKLARKIIFWAKRG